MSKFGTKVDDTHIVIKMPFIRNDFWLWYFFIIVKINIKESYSRWIQKILPFGFKEIKVWPRTLSLSPSISTLSFFHKNQTTNSNCAYSTHCGQNVKVTRFTLNDCIEWITLFTFNGPYWRHQQREISHKHLGWLLCI